MNELDLLIRARRSQLSGSIREELLGLDRSKDKDFKNGQYRLIPDKRWFSGPGSVTGSLSIVRDFRDPEAAETLDFRIKTLLLRKISIDIRPAYRIYNNNYPLAMAKEIRWIIRFFELIPSTETHLPWHFLEDISPKRFWESQVACSEYIELSDGWVPNWQNWVTGREVPA